jgi:uncharacterized NAD(P)/FAD-binding protein YdhS
MISDADVAIIGGGFSGTMVAAQLARRNISSILIEGGGRLGRGIAYSTREPAHVLNGRAEVMSAWPEDLEDFARLVEAEGGSAKDFPERRRFGRYLGEQLEEAVASGAVTTIEAMAVSARRTNGWTIALADGRSITAKALVLAIGNQEPASMGVADGISTQRYINNPWGTEARAANERLAGTDRNVLLLGTGLTAVDHVLALDAHGHVGKITMLSRRGQMPRGHVLYDPWPVEANEVPLGNVLKAWRWLRKRAGQGNWRAAVDAMRPHTTMVWRSWSPEERSRFIRHARPFWDVHRHRIATEVAERMKQLIGNGQLEIVAGRVLSMREVDGGVEVQFSRRSSTLRQGSGQASLRANGTVETRTFDTVVNCTGPLHAMARTVNPVMRQMLDDGLVEVDRIGIGLAADENDRAGEGIWAMGPVTKGNYWEIIAVPDIRGQAARVAEDIEADLAK